MAPADPIQLAADLPAATTMALPMWLLFGVLGFRGAFDLFRFIRTNGHATKGPNQCGVSSDPAFAKHCLIMENMLNDDPPRKHTDLLTQILNEQRLLRSDMKRYFQQNRQGP